jgi:hypothetical protein
MIADPTSYSIADFIPFGVEVYLRLAERQNAALWPGQFVALAAGLGAMGAAWRGYGRTLATLLALAWGAVAVTFHLGLLAELTFAAKYIGGAFLAQAGLMLGMGLMGGFNHKARLTPRVPRVAGYTLAAVGVVGYPLLGPLLGRGWAGAACFGILPDPTVLVTAGLLLVAARPASLAVLLPIPLAWALVSAAIDTTLELALWWLLPAGLALCLVGALWKALGQRRGEGA